MFTGGTIWILTRGHLIPVKSAFSAWLRWEYAGGPHPALAGGEAEDPALSIPGRRHSPFGIAAVAVPKNWP